MPVSSAAVTAYLKALDPVKRSTLEVLRATITSIIPDAEECISYRLPAFRSQGLVVAGFGAYKNHLSYFPHSGSVLPALEDDLAGYVTSRGTLRFAIDEPLGRDLVEKLIAVRIAQAAEKS